MSMEGSNMSLETAFYFVLSHLHEKHYERSKTSLNYINKPMSKLSSKMDFTLWKVPTATCNNHRNERAIS